MARGGAVRFARSQTSKGKTMDGARTIWRAARMPLLYRNFPTAYRNRAMSYAKGGQSEVAYRFWNGTVVHGTDGREEVRIINEIWGDRCYAAPGFVPAPGWTVVDIGANKGIFALWALHQARHDLRLVCYEPSPRSFSYLERNIRRSVPDDMLHNAAVGAVAGDVTLYELVGRSGQSSLIQSKAKAAAFRNKIVETIVPRVALSDVLAEFGPVDLLKVDAEGAEYEILADSPTEALSEVRRIVMEYDAIDSRDSSRNADDLFRVLATGGFSVREKDDHIAFLSR